MTKDMLGTDINVGDNIVYYNGIYVVKSIRKSYCVAMLQSDAKNPRNKTVYAPFCVNITKLIKDLENV